MRAEIAGERNAVVAPARHALRGPVLLRLALFTVVVVPSASVYWRTAYPTITWWDSSSYSLAAATLGVTSPPGSLLLTLLGWVATRIPSTLSPAHQLNLLAGVLAALTSGVVALIALRLLQRTGEVNTDEGVSTTTLAATIGVASGALALAFTATLWEHAVKLTPYILTALFTALMLWMMVRWWDDAEQRGAWRHLALLALLFGLDFSVHRSNALLLPAAVLWILIRRPRTLAEPRAWAAGCTGLAAGLAVQLLIIPIAATTGSPLNIAEPSTWSGFWDYVSLAQLGGNFLVELWPRNAPIWSVQMADLARVLRDNYLSLSQPAGALGVLPILAAIAGVVALWRRERRLAAAVVVVFVVQATLTVLYFNIPANYFRSLDRHYLPVLVTIAVVVACGTGAAMRQAAQWMSSRRWIAGAVAAAAVAAVPVAQCVGNWATHDASQRYFARDYADNALRTLPPRAIYFTVGDNDTFPLWYLQAVEGVRPDVRVVNLSLANADWYVAQLARRDRTLPLSPTFGRATKAAPASHHPDSTVVIAVTRSASELGLPAATVVPQQITVAYGPRTGADYLPADAVLLDIVRTNAWRDPLCFSTTAGADGMGWLAPYARLRGLHWCIVPVPGLGVDREVVRANLLERQRYRGYADGSVEVDDVARTMGSLYIDALGPLLDAERSAGAIDRCRDDVERLLAAVPPERLQLAAGARARLVRRCDD